MQPISIDSTLKETKKEVQVIDQAGKIKIKIKIN